MKSRFDVQSIRRADHSRADPSGPLNMSVRWKDGSRFRDLRPQYASGEQVDLDADREVIADHSRGRSVWLVRSGILRLQRHASDGRRQILSLFLPGEIVGYDHPWRDGMRVESATACRLCRIDRREFEAQLDTEANLRSDFLAQQLDQIERLRWLTWLIGTLRPEERLSAFLALATRFMPYQPLPDGTAVLTMVLARCDIADLLATTMETISRVSHSLEAAGVIEIRDPSHFRIIDLHKLAQLGRVDAGFVTMPFRPRTPAGEPVARSQACVRCLCPEAC